MALSSIASQSAASSSLDGSQLNALVARRAALRSQLVIVENQLATIPSTAASSSVSVSQAAPSGGGRLHAGRSGPLAAPITSHQHPPRGPGAAQAISMANAKGAAAAPAMSAMIRTEESLPGAMRPGRYAFWPKRLPGAQSRRGRGTAVVASSNPPAANRVVAGGVAAMPARGVAAAAVAAQSGFGPS